MKLKIKNAAEILGVSEKTVKQWIKEDLVPVYKIHHGYRFVESELREWMLKNKMLITDKALVSAGQKPSIRLSSLILKGGVHYQIGGNDIASVIRNAISCLPELKDVSREELVRTLMEREELMTTAVGQGIAIPHPRQIALANPESQLVAVCFLKNPVDFRALDGKSVTALFIVLSANQKRHLEILSQISYCCQREDFKALLKKQAEQTSLISYIEKKEREGEKKNVPH